MRRGERGGEKEGEGDANTAVVGCTKPMEVNQFKLKQGKHNNVKLPITEQTVEPMAGWIKRVE